MWILYVLILILMLGILVLVHEAGHFLVARHFHTHIYEFSIGMGPLIKSIKGKDGIDYSIRALPIGGYVSMAGEVSEDDEDLKDKNGFLCNKPWWQRILVLCAGVFNNFLMAFLLLFVIGLFWGSNFMRTEVVEVTDQSAYQEAGGLAGDTILEVDGKKISTWDRGSVILTVNGNQESHTFLVSHSDGNEETLTVTPKEVVAEDGTTSKVYGIQMRVDQETGFIAAIKYAGYKFSTIYQSMFSVIYGLVTGKLGLNNLSGPVGMYSVVEESAQYGLSQMLYLTAYISINLGFMNILPFPAFDGGHVVFVILEKLRGKPVDQKIEGYFHAVGFVLLMLLMIAITIKDIIGLF